MFALKKIQIFFNLSATIDAVASYTANKIKDAENHRSNSDSTSNNSSPMPKDKLKKKYYFFFRVTYSIMVYVF